MHVALTLLLGCFELPANAPGIAAAAVDLVVVQNGNGRRMMFRIDKIIRIGRAVADRCRRMNHVDDNGFVPFGELVINRIHLDISRGFSGRNSSARTYRGRDNDTGSTNVRKTSLPSAGTANPAGVLTRAS